MKLSIFSLAMNFSYKMVTKIIVKTPLSLYISFKTVTKKLQNQPASFCNEIGCFCNRLEAKNAPVTKTVTKLISFNSYLAVTKLQKNKHTPLSFSEKSGQMQSVAIRRINGFLYCLR